MLPPVHPRSRVARRVLAALILCVALLGPTAAIAASSATRLRSATYRGRTRQGIAVRLGPQRSGLRAFRYQARMGCSDGTTFTDDAFTDYVAVRRNRFAVRVATSAGAVLTRVAGRLRGRTATGTIRIIERYSDVPDANGNTPLDPNGSIVCDSGTVRWTARAR